MKLTISSLFIIWKGKENFQGTSRNLKVDGLVSFTAAKHINISYQQTSLIINLPDLMHF